MPPAEIPTSAGRLVLILSSHLAPSSGPYRVELRDPEGSTILTIDDLEIDADGLLTLSLAASALQGERILVLLDTEAQPPEPVEAYRVRRRVSGT